MALVWLFSPQYPLAMLPFGVYSVFHVATYTRTNLIHTIQPPQATPSASPSAKPTYKNSALADSIGKFVKEYYDLSMGLVAILEILLWFRLLLAAIIFTKGSWILLVLYTAFLRARFAQSTFVKGQVAHLTARVDALVGGQGTPPAARQVWEGLKGAARQFHDITDIGRYMNGPQPAPKKAN
jgi:transmembrane protein 33